MSPPAVTSGSVVDSKQKNFAVVVIGLVILGFAVANLSAGERIAGGLAELAAFVALGVGGHLVWPLLDRADTTVRPRLWIVAAVLVAATTAAAATPEGTTGQVMGAAAGGLFVGVALRANTKQQRANEPRHPPSTTSP
jgi:hypothetical protein